MVVTTVAPAQKKQGSSLLDKMRAGINNSGSSRQNIFYLKDKEKARFRFLRELDKPCEVPFHENFDEGVAAPCALFYGKSTCVHCQSDESKTSATKDYYIWPIFVYAEGAKKGEPKGEVKLFRFRSTRQSPVHWLLTFFDNNGTCVASDFIIERHGERLDTTYQIMPGPSEPFGVKGVKVPTNDEIVVQIAKAYDLSLLEAEDAEDEEEEEEEEEDVDPATVDGEDEDEEGLEEIFAQAEPVKKSAPVALKKATKK